MPCLLPFLRIAAILVALAAVAPSFAQPYPAKPIRIVNAFAPGGPSDLLSRAIGDKLAEVWGQPVIVEARTGAAGNIGHEYVAKQPADGYTLLTMPAGNAVVNPHIFPKLPYDPQRDFAPIALLGRVENVLVVAPAFAPNNVRELVAFAKSKPGRITFSSPGVGSFGHVAGEQLNFMAGIDGIHIPYKGTAPAMNDVMGNVVTMSFAQMSTALPQIRAGRLKALGVASLARSPVLPELPTIAEQGLAGFEAVSWYGLMAPAGTPRDVIAKLNAEVNRILQLPDVRERLVALGATPAGGSPEALAQMIRAESARLAPIIRAANIKAE
jgi:tripartite-type tricarboxylate transporter receptor subunit TctC